MPTSFGEPLTKLRAVPIRENNEPLVEPRDLTKRLGFVAEHPRFITMSRDTRVRRRVAEMLAEAANALPANLELRIIEGFRPISQQRFIYEHVKAEFVQRHPDWSKATLHRVVNRLCAPPDDKCPTPHSTGGAVDIAIVDLATGEFIDVASPYEWGEESAPTVLKGLSREAQRNRDLLIATMSATGITNYTGEWWHWSYGDSGWALRTGAEYAIYDRLPEAG
jgi:zinc D-Ala-D-Ala dipeptidase